MFKNYFKIAIRSMLRHKLYSSINFSSLAVGMACCFVILFYLSIELNYDTFHKDSDSIYRLVRKMPDVHGPSTRNPMAPTLKENFPEIELAVRTWLLADPVSFQIDNKILKQEGILFADQDFFKMFTYEFVTGDSENPLENPFSIVISQKVSEKYFGQENPIGKTISFDGKFDLQVTGVLRDIPKNSHLQFEMVIPMEGFNTIAGYIYGYDATNYRLTDQWMWGMLNSYLKLGQGNNPKNLEKKFPDFLQKYAPYNKELLDETLYLQPIKDIHLYSQYRSSRDKMSDIKFIYMIIAIGFVILFMSCFNYINLTTARFTTRLKEIGLRKVVGAQKKQLVSQFMIEALIFSAVSFLLSMVLIILFSPIIQTILGYQVSSDIFSNKPILGSVFLLGLLAAIICGSYPAIFFSRFRNANNLKTTITRKTQRAGIRNTFVIFQFSTTIMLLICTSLIYKQVQFLKSKDLGYTKDQIVIVPIKDDEVRQKSETIKNELKRLPDITDVSFSSSIPTKIQRSTTMDLEIDATRKVFEMSFSTIDYDFLNLYEIGIVKGRNFSKNFPSDLNGSIILNERATEILEMKNPIGQELNVLGGPKKVIGVVHDFNFETLHSKINPLVLRISGDKDFFASIKIATNEIPKTMKNIEQIFEKFSPTNKIEHYFLDNYFAQLYSAEENFGRTIRYFTLVAIIISFSGLFGLSFFATEQRTKEIGVRKIVGASVPKITFMLIKDFSTWTLLSNIIAWPLAYLIMNKWLQNFAYKTNIEIWTFILAGLVALAFTLLCVSYQSIKTALVNPVDSLRYE